MKTGQSPHTSGDRGTAEGAGWDSVSVIIPTLNEEEYLPILLESLQRQVHQPLEVLVVDADSTDQTCEIAKHHGATVIGGGGLPGFSRNLGAEVAKGEWVLFMDADLRLPRTAIEEALAEARRKRLDSLSCWFVPDSQGLLVRLNHWLSALYFWLTSKIRWAHSIGGFLLVRRRLHLDIDGFDQSIRVAEDQDYVLRLARAGRYSFTRRPVVEIAARRFDQEGMFRQSLKWLGIELHRLIVGEIKGDYFRYFK